MHQKKEKEKARLLRQSQWWKGQLARGVCYHCQQRFAPRDLTMDHLLPLVRGGFSTKNNCVTACKACNSKKGHQTKAELALRDLAQQDHKEKNRQDDENDE